MPGPTSYCDETYESQSLEHPPAMADVIVNSDDDTQDPDDMQLAEFFMKAAELARRWQDFQTMAAAWDFKLPEHKYSQAVRSDVQDFLVKVTESLSLVNGFIDGTIKVDNRDLQASSLDAKDESLSAEYEHLHGMLNLVLHDGIVTFHADEEEDGNEADQHLESSASSNEPQVKRPKH